MRLLTYNDKQNIVLTRDLTDEIPPYAILSHTWGPDEEEVSFQDLQDGSGKEKAGFVKIHFCGEQAKKDGLHYFWVDTCCIDKANHSEQSEAIISMYRWYKQADVCYAHLADVPHRPQSHSDESDDYQRVHSWKPIFRKSRWFIRGWTLQELLAPHSVIFYSQEWACLGTKGTLEELVHEITDIPVSALRGRPFSNFSIAERMRWQKNRTTKKKEDRAYCLLGIFNVFLPPMYGEGEHAFIRLKDEINKRFETSSAIKIGYYDSPSHAIHTQQEILSSDIINPRQSSQPSCNGFEESSYERRQRLLSSLDFEQMGSRQSTIKSAYASTCTWILKHSAYLDWIDPQLLKHHLGFLWINGKPGAGKSTLMKYVHAHSEKTKSEDELVVCFFFNARGDALEKSTTGMYRGLLLQLLQKATDVQATLDKYDYPHNGHSLHPVWSIDTLRMVFLAAVTLLGRRKLKIFIDALDECDKDQIREMVLHFGDLASQALEAGIQLYICFASRHYPAIDIRNGQKLILEDKDGHAEDLTKYVQSHLRGWEKQTD